MTGRDIVDAVNKRLFNKLLKADIRRNYAPNVADRLCTILDSEERAEHLEKFYNELMNMFAQYQRQQQQYTDALYRYYYK